MARIGYLYLHNGLWDGSRFIPASGVDRAKEGKVSATFGYHYATCGGRFQKREPTWRVAVIRNSFLCCQSWMSRRHDGHFADDESIGLPADRRHLKSVKSDDTPLPSDPSKVLLPPRFPRPRRKASSLGGIPELAKAISGKTFSVRSNELQVKTFTLNFFDSDSSWVVTTDTGKSDRPTERFTGLMGLDGIFRKSPPATYGINRPRGAG